MHNWANIKAFDKVPSPGPISTRENNLESIPETFPEDSYGDISILEYLGILLISFVIVRVFYYIIALLDSYGSKNEEKFSIISLTVDIA